MNIAFPGKNVVVAGGSRGIGRAIALGFAAASAADAAAADPGFAYAALLLGVFFGGLYSFRLVFYAFHGEPRMDAHTRARTTRVTRG